MKYKDLWILYTRLREHNTNCPFQNCFVDYQYDTVKLEVEKRMRKRGQHEAAKRRR